MECLAGHGRRRGKHGVEIERVEDGIDAEDAERKSEVTHAVDDKRLDGRGIGRRPRVPEANQEIGRKAYAFPAEEQLEKIVRGDERQHREGEEGQIGEKARPRIVVVHVADRIQMHERRHASDDHEHHRRQRIDPDCPVGFKAAGDDPFEHMHQLGVAEKDHVVKGDAGQRGRDEECSRRHQLRCARTDHPAEEAGDKRRDDRKKNDRAVHALAFHQIDVLDRDGAAVAEIDDENGKADRGFRSRDREHEQGEHLSNKVSAIGGERHEIDVDREQDELDRHQYDDHVLAVQEYAEDPDREEYPGDEKVMGKPDMHGVYPPCPGCTSTR
jgi:hypothetical protein